MCDLKQKLESRLVYVQKEIDFIKKDFNDPIHHQHYAGELARLDGTFGEKQFLEKLIAEIGDEYDEEQK